MFNFFLISIILFHCSITQNKSSKNHWIVWNIGQGQWVTHVTADFCLHYDVGGEIGSFQLIKDKLIQQCSFKKNHIFLSHWDFDHIINIPNLAKTFEQVCWQTRPGLRGKTNATILKITNLKIPYCTQQFLRINQWQPLTGKSTNDFSVVSFDDSFLLPGDSTILAEKKWTKEFKIINQTRILVLGHHGSRTSTSVGLLNQLPHLQLAIASARKARYGHPHAEVLLRLQKNKTPVLRTEDWGSIWFL